MFRRVTVHVSDLDASRRFYETVLDLPALEDAWHDFGIVEGAPTRGLHVAFSAWSRSEVDAFWQRGIDAGYRSDGDPGLRVRYGPEYYGAFLLDPDGNSVEAVFHGRQRAGGVLVDHLWLGVADLDASRRFWSELAPRLGLRIAGEQPERFHVAGADRSFALVADGRSPTQNLELAFPSPAEPFRVVDPDGTVVAAV